MKAEPRGPLLRAAAAARRRHGVAAGPAALELADLQARARQARALLARLRTEVAAAESQLAGRRAARLVEANEQLVIAALRAHTEARNAAQARDEIARAAALKARADLNLRRELVGQNAELEARVIERTSELILARDDALAAARAKERFVSNMSHEIRTPMAGMLGAMELLSHTELTPHQSGYLQVATTSGTALLAIINDVLDYAKIGAGRLHVAQEAIDVAGIVRSIATLFSAAAQTRGIELRLTIDPALPTRLIGDPTRLRQVLMNLVGNAMKFTPRGQVEIAVRPLAGGAGDRLHFEVSDTGIGIAESQQALIFEPFTQSEHPDRPAAGGTGLGLAISRDLVRAMGGELRVDSALGRGARFHFDLALAVAVVAAPAEAPAATSLVRLSGSVLLVDDDAVNQLIGTAMLESLGLEVVVAADGVAALERLAQRRYAAILMDCRMPRMDGYEATRRWRQIESLEGRGRTPVIALTANAFSSDVVRCLNAGMDDHLAKPYTRVSLHGALAHWLAAPNAGA